MNNNGLWIHSLSWSIRSCRKRPEIK